MARCFKSSLLFILLGFCAGCEKPEPGLRFQTQRISSDYYEGCDVGDLDADGHPDVVSGDFWYSGPGFEKRHRIRHVEDASEEMKKFNGDHLLDVDEDGLPDLVSGEFFGPMLRWWRNPGDSKDGWVEAVLVDTGFSANEWMEPVDLDGDGQVEFLVDSWSAEQPLTAWEIHDGHAVARRLEGVRNGHGVGVGDVDADRASDLVLSHGWYGGGEEWRYHPDWAFEAAGCPLIVADVDSDGIVEVVWGSGHDYGLYLTRKVEGGWRTETIDESYSQVHSLAWADLDGDGREELITGKRVRAHGGHDPGSGEPATLYYYKWDSGKFQRHEIAAGIGTGLQIRVRDLNADRRPDIVVAGKTGAYVLWNQGL